MRYRRLSETGDYVFGGGERDYLHDTPETVAQAVVSRLRLLTGEWFMDISAGTDWETKVLGANTGGTRDMTIFATVLGTQGVKRIITFASKLNSNTRAYAVSIAIDTIYGQAAVVTEIQ